MKNPAIIIGIICLLFIWWNLLVSVRIMRYLKSKGQKVSLFDNLFFVKGKIFAYLPLYKKISQEEDGKTGPLYLKFYFTFSLFILFLITGLIVVS